VIIEIGIIDAKPGQGDALEAGLKKARAVISQAEGYRGSTFHRCIENPDRCVIYIKWDSVDAHMKGFREGPLFPQWRAHFGDLMGGPPSVQHYNVFAGDE
jgi:heme-degrading monooxygenase HmoA